MNIHHKGKPLALPPSDDSLSEEASGKCIVSTLTWNKGFVKRIEPVGTAFHKLVMKRMPQKKSKHKANEDNENEEEEEDKIGGETFHEKWKEKRKNRSNSQLKEDALFGENLYDILGISELGVAASDNDIKTAYRKLALIYHPDKRKKDNFNKESEQSEETKKEIAKNKEIWLKVQNAYETLSTLASRRKYDSSLPFDDSIPDEGTFVINDETFYKIFGNVFKQNAIFSKIKPVPLIGNKSTNIKKVMKFYGFWNDFKSWRDFSKHDEYDPQEAEDRYEKRWMDKENKKIRDKYMKKERQRILKLVELARKYDPRIRKYEEQQREEKINKKIEKRKKYEKERQERIEKELEEERKRELQNSIKLEQERQEQLIIQQQKQERKNREEEFINLVVEKINKNNFDKIFASTFVERVKSKELISIISRLKEANISDCETIIIEFVEQVKKREEDQIKKIQEQRQKEKEEEKKVPEWTPEEMSLLSRGLQKFPGGLKNRWKMITEFIKTRTTKEVIEKARQVMQQQQYTEMSSKMSKLTFQEFKKNMEQKEKSNQSEEIESKVQDSWSPEQQKLLEEGLKKFPGTLLPKERWTLISKHVGGKTPKQCLERVKQIKQAINERKKQAK